MAQNITAEQQEFQRINDILTKLTPEGREAWLRKGADMVSTIAILEAGGYKVVQNTEATV